MPGTTLRDAGELLARLRGVLTSYEIGRVRLAARVADRAYLESSAWIRAGLKETEVAALFRAPLSTEGVGCDGAERADGFVFCMSGPDGADAYAAYQRTRARRVAAGDLVLVHCNSYVDGYWTDITRTYTVGEPDARKRKMYAAVLDARSAAFAVIRPGVRAADVDRAAREVMCARGFGDAFRHGLGHGVGFAAIDHNATPRVHPRSDDVLEVGMVFNVEPAIYIDGYGGMRHCDMVVVTETGADVLTPFHSGLEELTLT